MSLAPYTLEEVLHPRSVAIVGTSRTPRKWGHVAAKQLLAGNFPGATYLVNPSFPEILGHATYPSLSAIAAPVDLVVIATSFDHVPRAIDDCIAHGVKGIVIITAGFGETGPAGRALEEQMVARCREHGIRVIGSNCMGLYVRHAHLDGLGFTTFLSVGNAADVTFPECIQYLADDPETHVIAGYVEAIQEDALRHVTHDMLKRGSYKPVIILLSGATEVGVRAALAQTGTLATLRPDNDASLLGSGVVRVLRSDELLPVAQALAMQPPTPGGGRRVAIIGDGGGSVVATGDAAVRAGLTVPVLCR